MVKSPLMTECSHRVPQARVRYKQHAKTLKSELHEENVDAMEV